MQTSQIRVCVNTSQMIFFSSIPFKHKHAFNEEKAELEKKREKVSITTGMWGGEPDYTTLYIRSRTYYPESLAFRY